MNTVECLASTVLEAYQTCSRLVEREPCRIDYCGKVLDFMPLAGAASRKRFVRVAVDGQPFVLVVVPTEGGSSEEVFVKEATAELTPADVLIEIATWLAARMANVPAVFAADRKAGLVVMQDLGDETLANRVASGEATDRTDLLSAYKELMQWIAALQKAARDAPPTLPATKRTLDESALRLELEEFLLFAICHGEPSVLAGQVRAELSCELDRIARTVSAQPLTLIHRDLQSDNIMLYGGHPWVIDSQDACLGPATYDFASLLGDRKGNLSEEVQISLALGFWENRSGTGCEHLSRDGFLDFFRRTALQRLLKVAGRHAKFYYQRGDTRHRLRYEHAMAHLSKLLTSTDEYALLREVRVIKDATTM